MGTAKISVGPPLLTLYIPSATLILGHERSRKRLQAPTDLGGRVFWHPEMFYTWLDEYLRGKNFYTKNKTLEINDECHVKPPSRRRKAHSQSTSRIAAIEFISNEID